MSWQRLNLYIEWLSNIMYQFYCCDYLRLYSIYSITQCIFNSLCLLYISGSQSLMVRSILFAKDFHKIHTVYDLSVYTE